MRLSAFRLAFLLKKTVAEISEMPWDEFVYWQAYLSIEPPGQQDDQRFAALMAQITNMSGRSLPDRKTVKPSDFLGSPKRQQTMEEQIAFMKGLGNG